MASRDREEGRLGVSASREVERWLPTCTGEHRMDLRDMHALSTDDLTALFKFAQRRALEEAGDSQQNPMVRRWLRARAEELK